MPVQCLTTLSSSPENVLECGYNDFCVLIGKQHALSVQKFMSVCALWLIRKYDSPR